MTITVVFGVLVVIGVCLAAVAGLELVQRLVPSEKREEHNDVAGFLYAVVQRYGKIINIASVSAMKGGGAFGNTLYGATKAGVVTMTKGFARELAPMGINVNAIAPAVARTVMTEDRLTPELEEKIKARIPMGRLGEASDIACLAAF
jgi:NAD(P)-dependent dehydrogenase (short-subunit alcohol dehydrogenase family)